MLESGGFAHYRETVRDWTVQFLRDLNYGPVVRTYRRYTILLRCTLCRVYTSKWTNWSWSDLPWRDLPGVCLPRLDLYPTLVVFDDFNPAKFITSLICHDIFRLTDCAALQEPHFEYRRRIAIHWLASKQIFHNIFHYQDRYLAHRNWEVTILNFNVP